MRHQVCVPSAVGRLSATLDPADERDMLFWALAWDVSVGEIQQAIRAVGPSADVVCWYLATRHEADAGDAAPAHGLRH